jgi:hypothetical protein
MSRGTVWASAGISVGEFFGCRHRACPTRRARKMGRLSTPPDNAARGASVQDSLGSDSDPDAVSDASDDGGYSLFSMAESTESDRESLDGHGGRVASSPPPPPRGDGDSRQEEAAREASEVGTCWCREGSVMAARWRSAREYLVMPVLICVFSTLGIWLLLLPGSPSGSTGVIAFAIAVGASIA